MSTTTPPEAVVIDGLRLRQAREARNLSVAEVAALCTLSREQVQHIEDGGERPFYTPAHKLLAIRKYAAAMAIPYDEIVAGPGADNTMPVPDNAPASLMVHGEHEEATDLRLAAVERNAEIRRLILIGVVASTILLAFYAKMRGIPDSPPLSAPTLESNPTADDRQIGASHAATDTVSAAAPATRTAASPADKVATAIAADKGASPAAAKAVDATTKTASAGAAPAAPMSTMAPTAAGAANANAKGPADMRVAANGESCTGTLGADVKTWTPTYQRKADTRLFFISPKEAQVCVHDASGKAALLTLKARTGLAYAGKPPYVVQSPLLSEIDIYLQGMKARVPPQTPALRLQVTPVSAPDAG
ncbi:MAG: Helix-turn-helix domain [Pseudomonadota bacterium]